VNERPDIAAFQPLVGQTFQMRVGSERWIDVQLVELEDLGRRKLPDGSELSCFSLLFRSGMADHVPQAIYAMRHPTLGALDVFLVPIGPDAVGMRYQAVFN
jgi:hypothetical protein